MNSNLSSWALQQKSEKIDLALNRIKTDEDIIIYRNLLCNFRIGSNKISSIQFDTLIRSEDNDILIMLNNRDNMISKDVESYLDYKNLKYNEVTFAPNISSNESQSNMPELYFAKEKEDLDNIFYNHIKEGGTNKFEYYPFLSGNIEFDYLSNFESNICKVDGINFMGIVKLEDKIVLLIYKGYNNSINSYHVSEISKKYNLNYIIFENSKFNLNNGDNSKEKKLYK